MTRRTCYASAAGSIAVWCGMIGLLIATPATHAQQTSPPDQPSQPGAPAEAQADPQQPPAQPQAQTDAQGQARTQGQADAQTPPSAPGRAEAQGQAEAEAQGRTEARAETQSAEPGRRGEAEADARGQFGFELSEDSDRLTLANVDARSPLGQAGLRAEDEIIAVNGRQVSTQAELDEQLRISARQDRRTTLTVFRDGRMETIVANIAAQRPGDQLPDLPPPPGGVREDRYFRGALQPTQKPGPAPPLPAGQKPTQTAVQKGDYQAGHSGHSHHRNRRYR